MNETLQKLRERREEATKAILQLRDKIAKEDRDFDAEERGQWEKANKDHDDLGRRINILETADRVEKERGKIIENGPGLPGAEDVIPDHKRKGKTPAQVRKMVHNVAVGAWLRHGAGQELSKRDRQACKLAGLNPNARYLDVKLMSTRELRAQSVGTTTAGGFTVPQGFVYSLEYGLKMFNTVRGVADIMRTDTGAPLPWPMVSDVSNVGTLLAENTTVGASVDVAFTQATFNAYKISSGLVLASVELDQDSAFDLDSEIGGIIGQRIGRGEEPYFTTGTGTAQPAGIVTGASLGKTAASATAIAADELIDLEHSVDPAYRSDPSFGFMAHDNIVAALRKLKDAQGRYLWQNGLQDGTPERLLNRPMTINQSMASSIATTNKTVLCGAMKKFKIRDVGQVRVRRLLERYADIDQIAWIAFHRVDSKVLNPGTNPLKYLQQA